MTLMRFDPFRELDRLGERLLAGTIRTMPIEAYRRGDGLYVHIDVPGIGVEGLHVTVEGNVVKVEVTRTSPRQEGDELLADEVPKGQFSRQFFLGDSLDATKLEANLDRGVLTLTIPVTEHSKPRQVQVSSSSSAGNRTVDITSGSSTDATSDTSTDTTGETSSSDAAAVGQAELAEKLLAPQEHY